MIASSSKGIGRESLFWILDRTPTKHNIYLEGDHAVGKTEILSQYYMKRGYRLIRFALGQMPDPGDFVGLPDRHTIKIPFEILSQYNQEQAELEAKVSVDEQGKFFLHKVTENCIPKWWPMNKEDKVVIFLDEYPRAHKDVHNVMLSFLLDKVLNGFQLPDSCIIIAAGNPVKDGKYGGYDLDPAEISRFKKYAFMPTVEEWLGYARTNNFHEYITEFIQQKPSMLDPPDQINANEKYPDRRAWTELNSVLKEFPDVLKNLDMFIELASGYMGFETSMEFIRFIKTIEQQMKASSIVERMNEKREEYTNKINKMEIQAITLLNTDMMRYLRDRENEMLIDGKPHKSSIRWVSNIKTYLNTIPKDLVSHWFDELSNFNNDCRFPGYIAMIDPTLGDTMHDALQGQKLGGSDYKEDQIGYNN